MKKNYITPEINVIQPEALLCSFVSASVCQGKIDGERIDDFEVVNEDKTKDSWGSYEWGND